MKDNPTVKEKSLNPNPAARRSPQKEIASEEQSAALDERMRTALNAAGEKKAIDIVVLDLRAVASFTDYFVITNGANQRQVQAISDEVADKLKQAGTRALRIEGYRTAEWILLDYGDFIVHVFDEKSRRFYDLERLWREGKRVELPDEFANQSVSSLRKES